MASCAHCVQIYICPPCGHCHQHGLAAEYSKLLTEKKARYPGYRKAKEEMQELLRAQKNIELFFDEERNPEQTEHSR